MLSAGEVGRILRPNQTPKKCSNWVRYLRDKGFLLGLRTTIAYEYPSFQLNPTTGNVHEIVSSANQALLGNTKSATSDYAETAQWAAAKWWISATPEGENRSPLEILSAGELSQELLELLLPPR